MRIPAAWQGMADRLRRHRKRQRGEQHFTPDRRDRRVARTGLTGGAQPTHGSCRAGPVRVGHMSTDRSGHMGTEMSTEISTEMSTPAHHHDGEDHGHDDRHDRGLAFDVGTLLEAASCAAVPRGRSGSPSAPAPRGTDLLRVAARPARPRARRARRPRPRRLGDTRVRNTVERGAGRDGRALSGTRLQRPQRPRRLGHRPCGHHDELRHVDDAGAGRAAHCEPHRDRGRRRICSPGGCCGLSLALRQGWQLLLYSPGLENENYLRGVQETSAAGTVTFTTVFPGAYAGRCTSTSRSTPASRTRRRADRSSRRARSRCPRRRASRPTGSRATSAACGTSRGPR